MALLVNNMYVKLTLPKCVFYFPVISSAKLIKYELYSYTDRPRHISVNEKWAFKLSASPTYVTINFNIN